MHLSATPRESKLHLPCDLLLAVCGYIKFEEKAIGILKRAGAVDDQIFRFPEGSMPISALSKFVPERRNSIIPPTSFTDGSVDGINVPIIAS